MPEPLQSNLHLLTTEQRKTMAAMLRRVAENRNLPAEDRRNAALRADELDPPAGRPPADAAPDVPPSRVFEPE